MNKLRKPPPDCRDYENMTNNELLESIHEIDLLLSHLKVINTVSSHYVANSGISESKEDLGNVVAVFTDCIDMYVARLEVATERALKEYHDGWASA